MDRYDDEEGIKPLPPKSIYKVICIPAEDYKELQEQLSQELMKNVEKDKDIEKLESKLSKYKNMEFVKRLNRPQEENKRWSYYYLDTFKSIGSEIEPMNWKSLEYYFRLYIGAGQVRIKVRDGAMLIERVVG